jgi:hypothetical protein
MTRRNVFLPDEMWQQLEEEAAELGQRAGKPVSVAEAMRRILKRSLSRRQ